MMPKDWTCFIPHPAGDKWESRTDTRNEAAALNLFLDTYLAGCLVQGRITLNEHDADMAARAARMLRDKILADAKAEPAK
jgi:hypothetical protein